MQFSHYIDNELMTLIFFTNTYLYVQHHSVVSSSHALERNDPQIQLFMYRGSSLQKNTANCGVMLIVDTNIKIRISVLSS